MVYQFIDQETGQNLTITFSKTENGVQIHDTPAIFDLSHQQAAELGYLLVTMANSHYNFKQVEVLLDEYEERFGERK